MVPGFRLTPLFIVCDVPETLPYEFPLFCPVGADDRNGASKSSTISEKTLTTDKLTPEGFDGRLAMAGRNKLGKRICSINLWISGHP
ncbi:hypothetical protein ACSBLW_11510 [Thioclava sp. FR2]|uniref:hypothetical protein n=1 Tax=Thioclava sp. FR2 TaxID=3445780 RepID=UPI003EB720E1